MPMKAFDAFRCCFILLLCLTTPARALEAISLQLNFTHQFQFAGYYAAIEQGYYREAGLEVKLVEGSGVPLAEAAVLTGQAPDALPALTPRLTALQPTAVPDTLGADLLGR